jgi:murein L,D-transpeptidase YcbB/YkuD
MPSSIFGVVGVTALAATLATAFLSSSPAPAEDLTAEAAGFGPQTARVRAFLDANGSPQPLCATARGASLWARVREFYAARQDRPIWMDGDRPTEAGRRLVEALAEARRDGLDPSRYDPRRLLKPGEAVAAPASSEIANAANAIDPEVEVGLTAAFLRYASDLAQGRLGPLSMPFWCPSVRPLDLSLLLARAAEGRPDRVLAAVRPSHPQYEALREALVRYRALAEQDDVGPALPEHLALRLGARDPAVRTLRARLRLEGDLGPSETGTADVFDRTLALALRRFEARHGLAVDGVLDPDTLAVLRTPLAERLAQIELNLERWRWLAPAAQGRSVLVNIPTFELHAYEEGHESLAMRVVTGRGDSPTPVFSQAMTAIVFRPYWNVPPTIALTETMPAVLRDPDYLRRMGLEVVRGGFRQRPGPGNALGLVKFLLPNPFNVYLHDTPSESLFARTRRTFSHGCVRLEKPEELARWVLKREPGWTPARIASAMRAGPERGVALPEAIPVTIAYFTVWVDAGGAVQFRPDVYGHDGVQAPLLSATAGPAVSVAGITSALPHP